MGADALQFLLAFDVFTPRWAYVFRVALAAAVALGLAYDLQLETPYSAATTVFLAASPVQGVTLSKGMWRITGTLFGAFVTVVLFALFSQAPALFIVAFALWLGICVGCSTLLRHFRAYGAVVAGYTIGLVAYGAIDQPDQIFEHAIGRVSVVALGVMSLTLVTALFSGRAMPAKLQARLLTLAAAVGRLAADSIGPGTQLADRRQVLIGDLYALDDLLEFGATESAEVAVRAGDVRHAMAALFAVIVGCARRDRAEDPADAAACAEAGAAMAKAIVALEAKEPAAAHAGDIIADARRDLATKQLATKQLATEQAVADRIAIDGLAEILEDYQEALMALARFLGAKASPRRVRYRFHLDPKGAVENGARAAVAILLAGALWIATGWTSAFLMILLIAPFCGLLAMTGSPVAGSAEFTKGIVVAVIAGFVCSFGILPYVTGFPLLILSLLPFWMAGLVATTVPKTGPAGTAYLLTFMTMVGPTNPMVFDVANYLNSGIAFVLSGLFTLLSFRVLFPRSAARQARRIAAAIRNDAFATLRRAPERRRLAWQHRQHQRLTLLGAQLKGAAQPANVLDDALAAIHLGRAAFRIRDMLAGTSATQTVGKTARQGLRALTMYRGHPAEMASAARSTAAQLRQFVGGAVVRVEHAHWVAASFDEIAMLLDAHAEFFRHERGRKC